MHQCFQELRRKWICVAKDLNVLKASKANPADEENHWIKTTDSGDLSRINWWKC